MIRCLLIKKPHLTKLLQMPFHLSLATMQAKPDYLNICLWILGFLLFGYALSNTLKAIILKTMYNVEGETKAQMYRDLEKMREERRKENAEIEAKAK